MKKIPLNEAHIYVQQDFANQEDYFDFITKQLQNDGLITGDFYQAIIAREEKYPTGLNTGEIKVAIPHTDYQFSNTTELVITTLKSPLHFKQMDDPEVEVAVSIIILILFDKAEKQIDLLGEIMKIVQNQKLLKQVLQAETSARIFQLLED